MTKEEFKEMERIYIQWLHEHQKGDYSYKAFSHMSRTLEFAKYWSKLQQTGVRKSFTAEDVVNELEDSDHLDDAIQYFKDRIHKH